MGTTRLLLYNEALRLLGERKLTALTETGKSRRVLDDIWDNGWVDRVLASGLWQCAMRSVELASDPDVDPAFGFAYGFSKPSDLIRIASVASDEYFYQPVRYYTDEGQYWYADIDPVWVKYVSNDSSFGGDLALWDDAVVEFAALYGAHAACMAITQSDSKLDALDKRLKRRLAVARGRDGQKEPTGAYGESSWNRARRGYGRGMRMEAGGGRIR